MTRQIFQVRLNEERSRKLERILTHLRAIGLTPRLTDVFDFALNAAIEKINKPPK